MALNRMRVTTSSLAADVCKALDLEQPHKALSRLDDDEVGRGIEIPHPQAPGKMLQVSVVNEPGLYSLVLGSRKFARGYQFK